MKRILSILVLLISIEASAQKPPNYLYQGVRSRVINNMADSGTTTVPLPYPYVPGGTSGQAGLMVVDTLGGGKGFWYLMDGTFHHLTDSSYVGDSLARRLTRLYRKTASDSVFACINGTCSFAFKDSTGGGGGGSLSGGNLGGASVKRYVVASSGIKTDSAGVLILFDTTTSNVVITKVDTSKIAKTDTSIGVHGQAVLWDGGYSFHTGPVGGGFESVLNFAIGDSPSPQTTGDSILYNASFSGKTLYIFRERDFLHPGVDWTLSHDTITFHPAFVAGERMTIYTSSTAPSTISLEGPRYTDLTFGTVSNISATSRVWTSSTSSWNGHGLDAHTLTADGSFRARYSASDGTDYILGWNTSNTNENYDGSNGGGNGYEYGVSLNSGGTMNRIVNGVSTSLGVTISIGDYLRLNRTGTTVKIQTSTDGNTWTDRYTFAATTSATLYFNLNVFATGKCYFPQYL